MSVARPAERPPTTDEPPGRTETATSVVAGRALARGSAVDRMIDALRDGNCRPRQRGRSWSARCPAHEDRNPSLSVRGIEGRALIFCHAGCPTADVVAALGLAMRDLFDDPRGITYHYDAGRLVGRTPGKRFVQANTEAPCELFRLARVEAAVAEHRTIYVVEGEQDVLAMESEGEVATTAPMGAGKWSTVDPTPLAGARVVVVADDDEPGRRHAAEVHASLEALQPPATVTVVKAAEGKDAADHLTAGHTVADFVPIEVSAGPRKPRLKVVMASEVTERRVVYVWDGRIPLGALTLLPGEEGIGKTLVGIRLMADLTRGALAGEFYGRPMNVVVLAPEDGIADVFRPRLREAGADLTRVAFVVSRQVGDDEDGVILPRDLPLLTEAVAEIGDVALVWVDSLVTTLPDEMKSISYKDSAKVLRAIGEWSDAERLAVAAPWHLNKQSGSDTALRIMDSRAFRTAVRSMLLVVADPDAPEGVAQGVVALDKANAGTLAVPALRYRIRSARYTVAEPDGITGMIVERPASCAVAEWIGEIDGDGRAFAREALTPRIEKAGSAREWLREYLTEHAEAERTEVIAAGTTAGHSAEAVKRAARGVVHSEDVSGQRMVDGRRVPFRHAVWSLQSGHPCLPPPTEPSDPTGETSDDPIDPVCAGQPQSGQSGQSGVVGESDPTGDVGGITGPSPLHDMSRDEITALGAELFRQTKIDTLEDQDR